MLRYLLITLGLIGVLAGGWQELLSESVKAESEKERAGAGQRLVLNEVYPSPISGQTEWVEIYNLSKEIVDLAGWKLAKLSAGEAKFHEQIFGLNDETKLGPGQFLVMETKKVILTNTGATIYLFGPEEELEDEVTYPNLSKTSWARSGIEEGRGEWRKTATATPGMKNGGGIKNGKYGEEEMKFGSEGPLITLAAQRATAVSDEIDRINLSLSEITSCPLTGDGEWIEVLNDSAVDWKMDNWRVKNKKGTTRVIKEQIMKANSLNVIEFSSGLLVNAGDELTLETADGEVILSAELGACSEKGTSFVFDGSSWVETKKVTKGSVNIFEGKAVTFEGKQVNFGGKNLVTNYEGNNDERADKENNSASGEITREVSGGSGRERNNSEGNQRSGDNVPAGFKRPEIKLKIDEDVNLKGATAKNDQTNNKTEKQIVTYTDPKPNKWLVMPAIIVGLITAGIGAGGITWRQWKKDKKERQNEAKQSEKEEKDLADLF